MVTVRFLVGTNEDDAVLRVHDKIRANIDRIPDRHPGAADRRPRHQRRRRRGADAVAEAGGRRSLDRQGPVRPRGEAAHRADQGRQCRHSPTSSATRAEQIRVEPDPEKLSLFGVTLQQLIGQGARRQPFVRGRQRARRRHDAHVAAGQTLRGVPDIGLLLLTTRDGRPVYVRDVAKVVIGPSTAESRVWNMTPSERRAGSARRRSAWRSPSAPAPTPWSCREAIARAGRRPARAADPGRCRRST